MNSVCVFGLVLLVAAVGVMGEPTTEYPFCSKEISDKCPPIDGGDIVFFPDPEDCASYCECSSGEAFHFTCVGGLVYDVDSHICNWPTMVDCGDRPRPL
ncbi:hypothetical protein Pmani_024910 [Petrolisthes manimaculis]|uniref:Chitin-binding type-2 domain-containing protein n=1 Tax=Petrolisthes manimaculis TaxID=1843537 RepID=A0AAE1U1Q3_9EUCA|nr:hypothetical protein Pmani_024910 [Petrolisthes manimaculis]